MYTEQHMDAVKVQLKNRVLLFLPIELALFAGFIYSFVPRVQWLSAVLLSLLCIVVVFSLTLYILPVKRYQDYLRNALHGRNRQDLLRFDTREEVAVLREGVRVYPVTMRADTQKEELDERTFYWDANLPFPSWVQGQQLQLRSHERLITGWEEL